MTSLYLQVLAIGIIWTSFHCAGMCGPLIIGLTANPRDRTMSRLELISVRARRVLSYQVGRATTYALAGACVGAIGASLDHMIKGITRSVGLILALTILLIGILKLPPVAARLPRRTPNATSSNWVMGLTRRLSSVAPSDSYRRLMLVGMAMGFLPCMLAYWVLAIAATSGSMIHGALIMLLLVVMTTPVLVTASCSTALGIRSKIGPWVISVGMLISGVWLGLIAMAANDWISHQQVPFMLFGKHYTFMLF